MFSRFVFYTLLLLVLFASSAQAKSNGNGNNSSSDSSLETCSVQDLELTATPSNEYVNLLGCAGAMAGNDSIADSWLEEQAVWDTDDTLTNEGGTATDTEWTYLAKYPPTVSDDTSNNSAFKIAFSDCKDKDGKSVTCSDDSTAFGLTITFLDTTELLYNQFVFVAKASNYYSFYQVEVSEKIESLTGTLTMVSKNGLSHLTVWATNTAENTVTEANAPATIGLLAIAAFFTFRRKIK